VRGVNPGPALVLGLCAMASALAAQARAEDFKGLVVRLKAEKPAFARRQRELLEKRYDLSNRPAPGVTMSRGKAVQEGARTRLPKGLSWDSLESMSPEEIKSRGLWPEGFYPLPHPHHEAGGMVFPQPLIDETKLQTGRDLTRFDLDFDLPEIFLPEFPAPIYLSTRSDLGDVSQ